MAKFPYTTTPVLEMRAVYMINSTQPWLSPFQAGLCHAVLHAITAGENTLPILNAAMSTNDKAQRTNAQGKLLRCVPQADLPKNIAYEQFIYNTGGIPTRTLRGSKGALHDACNALMWLHYPRSKSVLNALQAAEIAAYGVQSQRGAVRDTLTLFDESALILAYPAGDAVVKQLTQREWLTLLHQRRADWHDVLKPYLFGHAVLQKLQTPYTAITAQVWLLSYENDAIPYTLSDIDALLASSLQTASQQGRLRPQTLLPLPVLGIPDWWAGNHAAQFYDDAQVFRPRSPAC